MCDHKWITAKINRDVHTQFCRVCGDGRIVTYEYLHSKNYSVEVDPVTFERDLKMIMTGITPDYPATVITVKANDR